MSKHRFALLLLLPIFLASTEYVYGEIIDKYDPIFYDTDVPGALYVTGEITPRTPLNIDRALEEFPGVQAIVLDSGGGSVHAGLSASRIIHQNGLSTIIPSDAGCYSACTFLFFAGSRRLAFGELGVHQVSNDSNDLVSGQMALSDIIDVLEDYDVPQQVIVTMLRIPPEEIYVLKESEKIAYGFLEGMAEPSPPAAAEPAISPQYVPAPAPPGQAARGFSYLAGTDLYGGDLGQTGIRGISLGQCEQLCAESPRCVAFSYVVDKQWCWPKGELGVRRADDGITSAVRSGISVTAMGSADFQIMRDVDFFGSDLLASGVRNVTFQQCEQLCREDDRCRAFSWVDSKQWCWPKSGVGAQVAKPGVVSGYR